MHLCGGPAPSVSTRHASNASNSTATHEKARTNCKRNDSMGMHAREAAQRQAAAARRPRRRVPFCAPCAAHLALPLCAVTLRALPCTHPGDAAGADASPSPSPATKRGARTCTMQALASIQRRAAVGQQSKNSFDVTIMATPCTRTLYARSLHCVCNTTCITKQ